MMSASRTRFLVSLMTLVALLTAACGGNGAETEEAGSETQEEFRIAFFEIVPLDIIDDLEEGFKEAMAESGYEEGENVTYEQFNAQGETTNCNTIADQLAQDDWDMVYVVGTSCVQAMYQKRPDFPIVFGAMTDPVGSGLADSFEEPKPNTTGTSDMVTPDRNLDLLSELLPEFQTIGTLGNPTEANTQGWMDLLEDAADQRGLEIINVPVQTTNDVRTGAQSLIGRVDIIIAPPDNTVEPAIGSVIRVALENEIPLLTAKADHADDGAFIGMGVDYFQLGQINGQQAARILEGTQPETIPVETMPNPITSINLETAEAIGVDVPDEILSRENVETVEG